MTIIEQLQHAKSIFWRNPHKVNWQEAQKKLHITPELIDEAEQRLLRFAPYFQQIEPMTKETNGLIESPIYHAKNLEKTKVAAKEALWLKRDDLLPIAGSIKARGGIHEVLKIAEQVATEHKIIDENRDYTQFNDDVFKNLFSQFEVVVGSTGNLGLSIGIMSAKLGFHVTVHMSHDAKQWKKDLLREKGATVVEHAGDYGKAVEKGRKEAQNNAQAFFIDDENSTALFSGYAVAARRLEKQLNEQGITVSEEQPLAVYLPCGVGGGPGGVAYGLKTVFGDAVHCYFVEPVQSPCMLLGMATGKHHKISVQDIGLSNLTAADGLAVGKASKFVGELMMPILDGILTVSDDELYEEIFHLYTSESIKVEPSAIAGVMGPLRSQQQAKTHLVWLTGGGMVPEIEWEKYKVIGEKQK
ncbi:MAG: D-serine ammonia-lyase [Kurthia sp.]|nr:D-serine ammonia-lyase [Candidatus Kurthia equi]